MKVRDKTAVRTKRQWRTERNLLILRSITVGLMLYLILRIWMKRYT